MRTTGVRTIRTERMSRQSRLAGVDIFRGLAVYAVVLVHSDEGIVTSPNGWPGVLQFANFAVPFFLAASFYFAISRLYQTRSSFRLAARLSRLVVPYAFWTVAYLSYKAAKYGLSRNFEQLSEIWQDPLAIVFLGGAAFHLYFLPLLLSGTVLIKPLERFIQKCRQPLLLSLLCAVSLLVYQLLISTGNAFELGPNTAFQGFLGQTSLSNQNPIVRLLLVQLAWIIRCFPYLSIAMLLNYVAIDKLLARVALSSCLWLVVAFGAVNTAGEALLPEAVCELTSGYCGLLLAIALSTVLSHKIKYHWAISSLSLCSFGIYLLHLFVVEGVQIVGLRLQPEFLSQLSALGLMALALVNFAISWLISAALMKCRRLSKLMFGT